MNVKRKIALHGEVCYADRTEVGSIIDTLSGDSRKYLPIALEKWIPQARAWEVVENFHNWDVALPRGKKAKGDDFYRGSTLRLRDRTTNDIILCDVLI